MVVTVKRLGHRDPEPRPPTHLRALLPGRPGAQPRHRWHRARARDRAARRAGPRWRGHGGVGRGRRLDVPLRRSRSRRRRRSRATESGTPRSMTDAPLILVVDDEQSYRDALRVALEREGFRVEVAADGVEALERFESSRPSLVLLDLMLPKMSGVDVCRELRSRSQVPIIMVTARNAEIDAVVGLEVGADDYVTKPFRLRELVARVRAGAPSWPCRRRPGRRSRRDHRDRRRATRRGASRSARARRGRRAAAQGVRAARAPARERRARAHARRAHRPGVGLRTTTATPRRSTCT